MNVGFLPVGYIRRTSDKIDWLDEQEKITKSILLAWINWYTNEVSSFNIELMYVLRCGG